MTINRTRRRSVAGNTIGAGIAAVLLIALVALGLAISTFIVWLCLEAIGGIDLSFREAVGGGLLLAFIKGEVSVNRD